MLFRSVEAASNYSLRHGEAVAIGTVAIARIAEAKGLCETGISQQISTVLSNLGLPIEIPFGLNPATFANAVKVDKKRTGGLVRFVIPVKIGEVKTGVTLDIDIPSLLPEAA